MNQEQSTNERRAATAGPADRIELTKGWPVMPGVARLRDETQPRRPLKAVPQRGQLAAVADGKLANRYEPGTHIWRAGTVVMKAGRALRDREVLEQAHTLLCEALICSAIDFTQPGSHQQAQAMRERYPILPYRSADHVPALSATGFPGSVIEAMGSICAPGQAARYEAVRRSSRQLPAGARRAGP